MPDTLTPAQRHKVMSHIRGRDTGPEMVVRRWLYSHGFRYRVNVAKLPGKPDIVLRKYNTIIFVNGCFWHGHEGCTMASKPKTNPEFWAEKIARNKRRDAEVYGLLIARGYEVVIIWECELRDEQKRSSVLEGLVPLLEENRNHLLMEKEKRRRARKCERREKQ